MQRKRNGEDTSWNWFHPMAADRAQHGKGGLGTLKSRRRQTEQLDANNDEVTETRGWRVNVSNIPSFVLYLAGAIIVAGILQEATGMGLPFALPAGLFVMVQIQKMMLTP